MQKYQFFLLLFLLLNELRRPTMACTDCTRTVHTHSHTQFIDNGLHLTLIYKHASRARAERSQKYPSESSQSINVMGIDLELAFTKCVTSLRSIRQIEKRTLHKCELLSRTDINLADSDSNNNNIESPCSPFVVSTKWMNDIFISRYNPFCEVARGGRRSAHPRTKANKRKRNRDRYSVEAQIITTIYHY